MRYYNKNRPVVEAIDFYKFLAFGEQHGANMVGGYPWSFTWMGFPVSHENNSRYLINHPTQGTINFKVGEILVCDENMKLSTYTDQMFNLHFERAI